VKVVKKELNVQRSTLNVQRRIEEISNKEEMKKLPPSYGV